METPLSELESALGYSFARPELLLCALTHRSLVNEQHSEAADPRANERLEFLGDAVLGLVVAEALFLRYPGWREGDLTRVRAQLVSRQHMAEVGALISLGRHIRLSRGEDRSGLRRKSTVLSNTLEAVLGAMFLDGGLDPVRAFVDAQVIGNAAEHFATELRERRRTWQLQIRAAGTPAGHPRRRAGLPAQDESGPDHRKRFLVEVRLKPALGEPVKPLARGLGRTKKHAEQDAARRALAQLTGAAATAQPAEEPAAE